MGIFKDLGFTNHNGEITAPSSKKFAGYTLEEVKAQINPTFVQIDASVDGQAIIDGSSLPTTVMQDTDWSSIQPVAYGFKNVDGDIGSYIKTLYSNQPAVSDYFGMSCAIGSTFMLIGSQLDDDKGDSAGKVEMFDLNGTYIKTIYSNQPAVGDNFGRSCAIGSTFMLIGSIGDDDKGTDVGKVEMFDLDGNYIKTIYSNQPTSGDGFGISCAIGSTFMLIGSSGDDDKGVDAGKVEMFDLNGTYIKTLYSKQPAASDYFGASCAIGSTVMLIGSWGDSDKGSSAGKVEMFDLNGNFIKTIYSNQPAASDQFGVSCAIGSTFMLIGSFYDDDKGLDAGKVEMFDLNGTYIKTIYSSQPGADDRFGVSCAIGSTFMLIGSSFDDDKGTNAGKVEMFTNSISIPRKLLINGYEQKIINDVTIPNIIPHKPMTFIKTIYSNQPAAGDWFGVSCAIGSTFMLIGSFYDDDKGLDAGKVEMFDLNGTYIKTIYSSQPGAGDNFGISCAIGSTFMLIGSYGDDDKGTNAGKVEMFDLNGNFIKTIYSNQPAAGDYFGTSCAIGSTFMLIGSYCDDDKGADAGKVEMFDLNGTYIKTIYSSQPAAGDNFGGGCAIGSNFMLIGSRFDDDKGVDAGKVEMFDLNGNYIKTIYGNQPTAGDYFGYSCAIGSTFMLIGSYCDDDKGADAGKVEMFAIDTTKTIFEKSISNSNTLSIKNEGLVDTVEINFFE